VDLSGFFYNVMPPFCIGAAGESLGDFGTTPGPIDIPEDSADVEAIMARRKVPAPPQAA
jgi:2,3-dihydroxyphenylpropionate 1,2-dioxygenase